MKKKNTHEYYFRNKRKALCTFFFFSSWQGGWGDETKNMQFCGHIPLRINTWAFPVQAQATSTVRARLWPSTEGRPPGDLGSSYGLPRETSQDWAGSLGGKHPSELYEGKARAVGLSRDSVELKLSDKVLKSYRSGFESSMCHFHWVNLSKSISLC